MTRKQHISREEQRRLESSDTLEKARLQREAAEHALAHAKEALNFAYAKGAFAVDETVLHAIKLAIFSLESHLQSARRVEAGAVRFLSPSSEDA